MGMLLSNNMVERSTKFYDQKNHGLFVMFKVNNLGFCPSLKEQMYYIFFVLKVEHERMLCTLAL
jgi:hypothetical protein